MGFSSGRREFWRRRRVLCLCRADSAPATSRLLLLLSGAVLAALVRPAAGFKPALSALLLGGGRDSGGRHRDAAVVRALPRGWGYTRPCPTTGAGGRRRPLGSLGLSVAEPHHQQQQYNVNGYEAENEGWMRTSHPSPLTSSAGIDGDDGAATNGVANGNERDLPKRGNVVTPEGIMGATDESMAKAARQSVPLKVMVFVDGTWLYYSFFGRGSRCHVSAKLGPGWNYEYRVKWEMLPVIISRALHAQMAKYGMPPRLVEVVRTVVFSSARRDTDKDSARLQMFKSMREQNFEVHMATTMGVQEKCIDIALAVEMMHYATIPDTYDVGVLVTGDKDFMPAMSRTRQKGRRVCLCSMRNSCNNDLLRHDAHVMDFAPVWIDEYLDDMMEYAPPPTAGEGFRNKTRVPSEILCEIIVKLIESEGGTFRSRELGRQLQKIPVLEDGTTALTVVKETWGSLTKFLLDQSDVFQLGKAQSDPEDPSIRQFTVSLVDQQNSMKSVKLGEVMDDDSSEDPTSGDDESVFDNGGDDVDDLDIDDDESWGHHGGINGLEQEQETAESLSLHKVPKLKELLRDRGLPVSGNKSILIARLMVAIEEDAAKSAAAAAAAASTATRSTSPLPMGDSYPAQQQQQAGESPSQFGSPLEPALLRDVVGVAGGAGNSNQLDFDAMGNQRRNIHAALVSLVNGIIDEEAKATGVATVSSRDVGRGLSRLDAPDGSGKTALTCLKDRYPSLMSFLRASPDAFEIETTAEDREFVVSKADQKNRTGVSGGGGSGSSGWGSDEERRSSNGGARRMAGSPAGADGSRNRSGGGGLAGW